MQIFLHSLFVPFQFLYKSQSMPRQIKKQQIPNQISQNYCNFDASKCLYKCNSFESVELIKLLPTIAHQSVFVSKANRRFQTKLNWNRLNSLFINFLYLRNRNRSNRKQLITTRQVNCFKDLVCYRALTSYGQLITSKTICRSCILYDFIQASCLLFQFEIKLFLHLGEFVICRLSFSAIREKKTVCRMSNVE